MGWARRFQFRQRAGIGEDVPADGDRHVVATELAFAANVAGYPPDPGMVEQQRLDRALQHVDQIVVAADVRQLVNEKSFHLFRRQSRERAHRHQHHRTKPAHYRRRLHQRRYQQPDRAGDANPRGEPVESVLPFAGAGRTSLERSRSATIQPPISRIQNAIAPKSQIATTQGRNGAGTARYTAVGKDTGALLMTVDAAVELGTVKETVAAAGAGWRSRVQVRTGAAAIAASAAHARRYRAFGPAERAIHFRAAA